MGVTAIQNVTNARGRELLFINTENSGNNRTIAVSSTREVGNAWIPWCSDKNSFLAHHIQIVDADSEQILWYIWQRQAADGDLVRVSRTGFEHPGAAALGVPETGGSRNLWIDGNGLRIDTA